MIADLLAKQSFLDIISNTILFRLFTQLKSQLLSDNRGEKSSDVCACVNQPSGWAYLLNNAILCMLAQKKLFISPMMLTHTIKGALDRSLVLFSSRAPVSSQELQQNDTVDKDVPVQKGTNSKKITKHNPQAALPLLEVLTQTEQGHLLFSTTRRTFSSSSMTSTICHLLGSVTWSEQGDLSNLHLDCDTVQSRHGERNDHRWQRQSLIV